MTQRSSSGHRKEETRLCSRHEGELLCIEQPRFHKVLLQGTPWMPSNGLTTPGGKEDSVELGHLGDLTEPFMNLKGINEVD